MVFSFRTLFLFIRGIDQTGRALTDPTKKLTEMEKAQQALATSGYRLLFAGAAFMAFAAMAGIALFKIIEKSTIGARVMDDFGKALDRFQRGISEAIIKNFGEDIKNLLKSIEDFTRNPENMNITAKLIVGVTAAIGEIGGLLALLGGIKMFLSALLPYLGLQSAAGAAFITAAGEIAIPVIVALVVKDLIWMLLPETIQKGITDFNDMLKKQWTPTQREFPLFESLKGNYDYNRHPSLTYGQENTMPTTAKVDITIQQTFNGPTNPEDVKQGTKDGIVEGMTIILGAAP